MSVVDQTARSLRKKANYGGMSLENLGWNEHFQSLWDARIPDDACRFRITEEHRGRYKLAGGSGEVWAEVAGRLRHNATSSAALPGVGDWVAAVQQGQGMATIVDLLDRRTALVRQAAGRRTNAQLLAANVDLVFVVTSCNDELNLRRIERYLTLISSSGADAVIVLNKIDLCADPQELVDQIETVAIAVPVIPVSALTGAGIAKLEESLAAGKTIAFVGSSGVGKSTLVNFLAGREVMAIAEIRKDGRGRHTTRHRELIQLVGDDGVARGLLIDTPGIRELQLWGDGDGLSQSFRDVEDLAAQCRFRDCTHASEPDCAVSEAVTRGELSDERLSAFRKLEREQDSMERRRKNLRTRLDGKPPTTPKG